MVGHLFENRYIAFIILVRYAARICYDREGGHPVKIRKSPI